MFFYISLQSDDDRNKEKVEIEKTVAQSQMISNPGTQRIATLTAHGEGLTFIGTQVIIFFVLLIIGIFLY